MGATGGGCTGDGDCTGGDACTALPHWVQKRELGCSGAPQELQYLAFISVVFSQKL